MKHAEQCAKIGPEYQNQVRSCPAMWCSHLPPRLFDLYWGRVLTCTHLCFSHACPRPRLQVRALRAGNKSVYQGIPLPSDITPDTFTFDQYMSPVSGSTQGAQFNGASRVALAKRVKRVCLNTYNPIWQQNLRSKVDPFGSGVQLDQFLQMIVNVIYAQKQEEKESKGRTGAKRGSAEDDDPKKYSLNYESVCHQRTRSYTLSLTDPKNERVVCTISRM